MSQRNSDIILGLTRTQGQALDALNETGRQWPMANGRFRGDGPNTHCRWSQRTLQALVDAGLARWADSRHGVLPHIIPIGDES